MLDQMTRRLFSRSKIEDVISTVLDDVIALHGAEFGNVQMPMGDCLVIVDHRGFLPPFLEIFRKVSRGDGSACGRAIRSGVSVIISDIIVDEEYTPFRDVALKAGYRAVQTTPLITGKGQLMGVVSTHFANVHVPTPIEMDILNAYSGIAADHLHDIIGGGAAISSDAIAQIAGRLNAKIYAAAPVQPRLTTA